LGSDALSSTRRGAIRLASIIRRVGALLAASSAVLHAFTLSHAGNPIIAVGMVAMIVACLFCAHELWTRDTLRGWVLVGLMNLAMIGVHLPMPGGHHHHGSVPVVVAPASGATAMAAATGAAILEALLAAAVLLYRTRHHAHFLAVAVDQGVTAERSLSALGSSVSASSSSRASASSSSVR
jgi:hypothetical protein